MKKILAATLAMTLLVTSVGCSVTKKEEEVSAAMSSMTEEVDVKDILPSDVSMPEENGIEITVENVVTMEAKTINLEKVDNARQLGGYITTSGKKIVDGRLLRTGKLNEATEEDIKKLKDLNLSTIIDLRTQKEIRETPDPKIDGVTAKECRVLERHEGEDLPIPEDYNEYMKLMVETISSDKFFNKQEYVRYLIEEQAKVAYSNFFKALLIQSKDEAILWHCSAGKDRVGVASMLLLSVLEVDKETILKDFYLSNEFHASKAEHMLTEVGKFTDDPKVLEKTQAMFGVSREYMEIAMSYTEKEYGSVINYTKEVLGLTDADIEALRAKYLTDL